jgi:hypothetical protein
VTDDLERAFLADNDVVPSSGFTASVMAAVRTQAATPPPIQFPWARAVPIAIGAALVLVVFVGSTSGLWRAWSNPAESVPSLDALQSVLLGTATPSMLWSVAGICLALLSASIGSGLGAAIALRSRTVDRACRSR